MNSLEGKMNEKNVSGLTITKNKSLTKLSSARTIRENR